MDDPNETPIEQSYRLLPASQEDEPQTDEEMREAEEFAEKDPEDKGNRKVRYQKGKNAIIERYASQDLQYMLAAASHAGCGSRVANETLERFHRRSAGKRAKRSIHRRI